MQAKSLNTVYSQFKEVDFDCIYWTLHATGVTKHPLWYRNASARATTASYDPKHPKHDHLKYFVKDFEQLMSASSAPLLTEHTSTGYFMLR